ncbi:MAG: hypothetical protein Q4A34_00095 [Candidatus Saccharibacteria bacterium]|nr:hypothetical protein [Candidatus Saccharibacteria bacterium]
MSKLQSNYYFKRERIGLAVVGGVMALMVAFSLTPTFAGIVATITNSVNTASTGTLVMEEKNHDGSVTCTTTGAGSATCATINKYGGQSLAPGGSVDTTVKITNKGTIAANAFTVKGGTCSTENAPSASVSGNGDLCDKMTITIRANGSQVWTGTAKAFQQAAAQDIKTVVGHPIAANETVTLVITAALAGDANASFQGRQISQPITWQFSA